jgi:hypothetical protein
MVAGREVTPTDRERTAKLMNYWAHGAGAARIGWGSDGDYNRCLVELGRHVPPGMVHGLCSNLHVRATGARPGHAAGEHGHR